MTSDRSSSSSSDSNGDDDLEWLDAVDKGASLDDLHRALKESGGAPFADGALLEAIVQLLRRASWVLTRTIQPDRLSWQISDPQDHVVEQVCAIVDDVLSHLPMLGSSTHSVLALLIDCCAPNLISNVGRKFKLLGESCLKIVNAINGAEDDSAVLIMLSRIIQTSGEPNVSLQCLHYMRIILDSDIKFARNDQLWEEHVYFAVRPSLLSPAEPVRCEASRVLIRGYFRKPATFGPIIVSMNAEATKLLKPIVAECQSLGANADLIKLLDHHISIDRSRFRRKNSFRQRGATDDISKPVFDLELQEEDDSPEFLLTQFLDLESPRFTAKFLNFVCNDQVLKQFVGYVTRCPSPLPDVNDPALHAPLQRSFQVMRLLSDMENPHVLSLMKIRVREIASQLLTEGFRPGAANLYHVCVIVSYIAQRFAGTIRDIIDTDEMAEIIPILIDRLEHPAVPNLLHSFAMQSELFPHLTKVRFLSRVLEIAMECRPDSSEAACNLLEDLLRSWCYIPNSAVHFHDVDWQCLIGQLSSCHDSRVLTILVRFVSNGPASPQERTSEAFAAPPGSPPRDSIHELSSPIPHRLATEFSNDDGIDRGDLEQWALVLADLAQILSASLAPLCSRLIRNVDWPEMPPISLNAYRSNHPFGLRRLRLLSLIAALIRIEARLNPSLHGVPDEFWPVLQEWMLDCHQNPFVLMEIRSIMKAVLADSDAADRILMSSEDPFLPRLITYCKSIDRHRTAHNVLLELFSYARSLAADSRLSGRIGEFLILDSQSIAFAEEFEEYFLELGPSSNNKFTL